MVRIEADKIEITSTPGPDAGRNRWKIEDQGFNRQKHWQGKIEHTCSFMNVHSKITI